MICEYDGRPYEKLDNEEALEIKEELEILKEEDPFAYRQFARLIKDYVYRWDGMDYSNFLRFVFAVYD